LVTFRLDPEEYAALRRVCVSAGARSISEFAREAVLSSVESGGAGKSSLEGDLATLTGRLNELDRVLKQASGLIERVLGSTNNPVPDGQKDGGAV
jgi:hypothetical protein